MASTTAVIWETSLKSLEIWSDARIASIITARIEIYVVRLLIMLNPNAVLIGSAQTERGEPMSDLIDRQAAIDVVGIDEVIRCEMCRNPMHTDRGCDGGCTYDEKLYKRIMQILDERI